MSELKEQRLRRLQWRGIEPDYNTVCKDCTGSGVKLYGSTSTWRGGIGGSMMTNGVCDKCWGSGKEDSPWVDLRKLANTFQPKECKELQEAKERMEWYDNLVRDNLSNIGYSNLKEYVDAQNKKAGALIEALEMVTKKYDMGFTKEAMCDEAKQALKTWREGNE